MAQTTQVSRILQIQTQSGTLVSGQPKVQRHNFANVAMGASDDDILAVGQALAALMADPLVQIARIDQTSIAADSGSATGQATNAGGTTSTSGTATTASS